MKTLYQINSEIEAKLAELNKLQKEKFKINDKLNGNQTKFLLKCSYDIALKENEIWPDGDAPIKPCVQDVKKAIETSLDAKWKDPSIHKDVMEEWNLHPRDGNNHNITVHRLK